METWISVAGAVLAVSCVLAAIGLGPAAKIVALGRTSDAVAVAQWKKQLLGQQERAFWLMIASGLVALALVTYSAWLIAVSQTGEVAWTILRFASAIVNGAVARFFYRIWRDCNSLFRRS